MGVEEKNIAEQIHVTLERKVVLQALFIGFLCFIITGFLIHYLSCCVITYGLSLVFGSTLGFLGLYFVLMSQPLFETTVNINSSEDEEEELEFQSMMKIE